MLMLAIELLGWWYGVGWRELARRVLGRLEATTETFSLPILLRTLFAPWRRIVTYADRSVIGGMRAALDNSISRMVGFGVRSIVIITASIFLLVQIVFGLVAIVIWPILPLASIGLLLRGLLP